MFEALLRHLDPGTIVGWDDNGRFGIHTAGLIITPQYETIGYRLDFAVLRRDRKDHMKFDPVLAVEVDGHEFHERTKEQAERDKRRDRELQAAGWRVFRFTGSEIVRSPHNCAYVVVKFLFGIP